MFWWFPVFLSWSVLFSIIYHVCSFLLPAFHEVLFIPLHFQTLLNIVTSFFDFHIVAMPKAYRWPTRPSFQNTLSAWLLSLFHLTAGFCPRSSCSSPPRSRPSFFPDVFDHTRVVPRMNIHMSVISDTLSTCSSLTPACLAQILSCILILLSLSCMAPTMHVSEMHSSFLLPLNPLPSSVLKTSIWM